MEDLRQLRDAIDAIDVRLLDLLNERARLAQEIGRIKELNGRPVYAPGRAEQLMRRLEERSSGPLGGKAIRAIYREIMSASLALEKDTVIACGGEPSGPVHMAAREFFGSSVRYVFHPLAGEVVAAVAGGEADCGVIPIRGEGDAAVTDSLRDGKVFLCASLLRGEDRAAARYFVVGSTPASPSGEDCTAILTARPVSPGELSLKDTVPLAQGILLEIPGHSSDPAVSAVLETLRGSGADPVVCGTYPRPR